MRRITLRRAPESCLLGQRGVNWNRWEQRFWPTVYLIDRRGHVRYRWEGELDYENAGGEAKMARLVDERLNETY